LDLTARREASVVAERTGDEAIVERCAGWVVATLEKGVAAAPERAAVAGITRAVGQRAPRPFRGVDQLPAARDENEDCEPSKHRRDARGAPPRRHGGAGPSHATASSARQR
jgi:hypothetical protein